MSGPAGVVGYYVHHHGRGHLHRALRLSRALGERGHRVTVLSSLPAPADPDGAGPDWVQLPRDDDGLARTGSGPGPGLGPRDPEAGGMLHWAPLGHPGFRARQATISAWIEQARPDAVVSDVSQEVTVLCRLHGVPVVSVVLPGHRDDAPHLLGLGLSSRLVGFWPSDATQMLQGLPPVLRERVVPVGALSRFEPASGPSDPDGPDVVVLGGMGGDAWSAAELDAFIASAPHWRLHVLGRGATWVEDPWPLLRSARVVVTHGGQNALAEVAAARVPALVVPAARPFEEQVTTAAQLVGGPYPVRSVPRLPDVGGDELLSEVAGLDAAGWSSWCDGQAASRFVGVVEGVLAESPAT